MGCNGGFPGRCLVAVMAFLQVGGWAAVASRAAVGWLHQWIAGGWVAAVVGLQAGGQRGSWLGGMLRRASPLQAMPPAESCSNMLLLPSHQLQTPGSGCCPS